MSSPIDLQGEPATGSTWAVPREWAGQTAFLVGGGPSLLGFNPDCLLGRGRVIVINKSVLPAGAWPGIAWADVMYFCDRLFWLKHGETVRAFYRGARIVSLANLPENPEVLRLTRRARLGLSDDPRQLCHGASSGYQCINLAYLFGANRIVLLGYDMGFPAGGRTHVHDGYGPKHVDTLAHQLDKVHRPQFDSLKGPLARAGVEVINASPWSALDTWPRMSIADALALC